MSLEFRNQTQNKLKSFLKKKCHFFLVDFDLARIDERLRSLGIDPQLIDQTEIDEVSTLDLSEKIEEAIEIKD